MRDFACRLITGVMAVFWARTSTTTDQLATTYASRFVAYCGLLCLIGSAAMAAEPPITAIAFAPDGQSVVVGSQAGLAVYHWPDLGLQRKIDTALVNVHDLVFAPGGQSLAIAGGIPSEEGLVEILAWPSGVSSRVCHGHTDCVLAVAWKTDSVFATASLDLEVAVWNADTGVCTLRLKGHSRGVTSLCFLTEGDLLVSGGLDQNLRVWSLETGRLVRTLNNHTRAIHQIVRRPAAHGLPMLASVSDDRTVRLWQPTIGRMVRFARLDSAPLAASWLPDGSRIVVATTDGHVRLIDPDTANVTLDLPAVDGWAYSLCVHPTDGTVLIGGRYGQLERVVVDWRSTEPKSR